MIVYKHKICYNINYGLTNRGRQQFSLLTLPKGADRVVVVAIHRGLAACQSHPLRHVPRGVCLRVTQAGLVARADSRLGLPVPGAHAR